MTTNHTPNALAILRHLLGAVGYVQRASERTRELVRAAIAKFLALTAVTKVAA